MACICCKPDKDSKRIETFVDPEAVVTVIKDNAGTTIEKVVELDIRDDGRIVPIQEGTEDPQDVDEGFPSKDNTKQVQPGPPEADAGHTANREASRETPPDKKTLDDLDAESGDGNGASKSGKKEAEAYISENTDISHLVSKVTELTSSKLLRAVSVTQVLAGGGKEWAGVLQDGPSSQYCERLFSRSVEVGRYKEYLSHRREDPRYKKVITLLIYYNGVPAAIMGTIVAIVMCVLRVLDYLPAAPVNDSANAGEIAPWSVSAGYLTFLICLFFWHRLPQCMLGSAGRKVFADNYCINYSDAAQKEKGIRNFIGYISQSERILVMWSGDYFTRLWTTLEIAASVVVSQHKDHRDAPLQTAKKRPLVFRPLNLSVMTLCGSFLAFLSYLVSILTRMTRFKTGMSATAVQAIAFMAIAVFVWPLVIHSLQILLYDRSELKSDLNGFDAHAGEEEDADERQFIFDTISQFFRGVPQFNSFVRTHVYDAIGSALGSGRTLPVYSYVFGMLPMFWAQLDYAVYYFDFYSDYRDRAIEYCINQIAVVACIFAQFPILVIFLKGFELRGATASIISSIIIGLSHAFFFLIQVGAIIALSEVEGLPSIWPSAACAGGYIFFALVVSTCASSKCCK